MKAILSALALVLALTSASETASARAGAYPAGTDVVRQCNLFDNDGVGWGSAIIYKNAYSQVIGLSFEMIVFELGFDDQEITNDGGLLSVTSKSNPGSLSALVDETNKAVTISRGRTRGVSYRIHRCTDYQLHF